MPFIEPITVLSPAKINLALDVVGRDELSGYHEIDTVLYEVRSLNDQITITPRDDGKIVVECDHSDVSLDETNTAYRAAAALTEDFPRGIGITISILKKISVSSGLGGGASNAAATLRGINQLFNLKKPRAELVAIAKKIGMDVPFFLHRHCARGTHFGEDIEGLSCPDLPIDIIETGITISSREAYSHVDMARCGKSRGKTERLIKALRRGNIDGVIENAHNDFEEWAFEKYSELTRIKRELEKTVSKTGGKVMLAGSGGALVILKTPAFPPSHLKE